MKTYAEFYLDWKEWIKPLVVKQYGKDDTCALSESWNDYTDSECKNGSMTNLQYSHCPAYDEYMPDDEDSTREYILSSMRVKYFIKRVSTRLGNSDWHPEASHFQFCISRNGKEYRGYYSRGPAVKDMPDINAILYCILSDASAYDNARDFQDFCDEFGYDNDSIRALNTYKACGETSKNLHAMFSDAELSDLNEMFEGY